MAGFTPLSQSQFRTILVNQFQASLLAAGVGLSDVPDTSPATVMGAAFDAVSLLAAQQQYQDTYVQQTSRLASIPANADGSPNPDVASYVLPFGFAPLGGSFATSNTFSLNLASVSNVPVVVPCGLIFQRSDGVPYVLTIDGAQPAYNGANGYTIPAHTLSVLATAVCVSSGTVGNVANPALYTWQVYSGPGTLAAPALGSITNPSAITSGAAQESDAALKARFALGMQNGKWGVITAIKASVAGSQIGLTYSYGDYKNPDGSYHGAFFTIVVNIAGSALAPTGTLITNVSAAVGAVRAGGIEYIVVPPILVAPTITGVIAVLAGQSPSLVLAAVQSAVQAYVNGIGVGTDGGTTTLSYAQTVATVIGVAGVVPAGTSVLINGVAGIDVVAPFGSQIVAPAAPAFTTV